MFRIKIVLGVMALFFLALILFGCSSSSDDDDENITSEETLYEFRIGDMSIDPDIVQKGGAARKPGFEIGG